MKPATSATIAVSVLLALTVGAYIVKHTDTSPSATDLAAKPGDGDAGIAKPSATEQVTSPKACSPIDDIGCWSPAGLPAHIVQYLDTDGKQNIAPPEQGHATAVLGVNGEAQILTSSPTSDWCGSGGCWWMMKDASGKIVLEGQGGGIIKTEQATNGYYDVFKRDRWFLAYYKYQNGKYVAVECYHTKEGSNGNGPGSGTAEPTACGNSDYGLMWEDPSPAPAPTPTPTSTPSQVASVPQPGPAATGFPVPESTFVSAYVQANMGQDGYSNAQLAHLARDTYNMAKGVDRSMLRAGVDTLDPRAQRAMIFIGSQSLTQAVQ